MMGLSCDEPTYVYGDKHSILSDTYAPVSRLKKNSNSIAYHFVCELVARYEWRTTYVNMHDNTSDSVTKYFP